MKSIFFLVLCFPFEFSFSQTIDVLKQDLTSGDEKKWDFNRDQSDSIKRGFTVFTLNFHLDDSTVDIRGCKGDSCSDSSLGWKLDSVDSRFTISFSRGLDVLLGNKKFEIQFVLMHGTKFLRFRRNGITVEQPTLDYYFQ